jgi:hypothetical protein
MLAWPSSALAWSAEGHQIVALIAAHELSPSASKAVIDLLGGTDVSSAMLHASTWADEIRSSRPSSATWHYVNIEIGTSSYSAKRDCQHGDCVVKQIERDEQIISDKVLSSSTRAEALRFLIHFVADVHQPLHAADEHDRGGNDIRIIYNGTSSDMHTLWDRDMVKQLGDDPVYIASALDSRVSSTTRKKMQTGTPVDWANESFRMASREIYAKYHVSRSADAPITIPKAYLDAERPRISTRLLAAGLRLAWLLNKTWPQIARRAKVYRWSN